MLIEPPFCNNLLIRGEGLPPPPVGSAKRRVRADPGRWPVQRRRDLKLPDDKILVAGVLDTSTNYVEHPELVAERLCRFADIVGRERVMAGSDCGFSTFAGYGKLDPDISFKKLRAMAEGAAIASRRLWGRA
jgi:hypothetical protein